MSTVVGRLPILWTCWWCTIPGIIFVHSGVYIRELAKDEKPPTLTLLPPFEFTGVLNVTYQELHF